MKESIRIFCMPMWFSKDIYSDWQLWSYWNRTISNLSLMFIRPWLRLLKVKVSKALRLEDVPARHWALSEKGKQRPGQGSEKTEQSSRSWVEGCQTRFSKTSSEASHENERYVLGLKTVSEVKCQEHGGENSWCLKRLQSYTVFVCERDLFLDMAKKYGPGSTRS